MSSLRDDLGQFDAKGAAVIAVNPAGVESHDNYTRKFQFNFPLLSDPDRSIAQAYCTLKEDGKSIQRTVYIIDRQGVVRYAKQGMPKSAELLQVLEGL